MAVLTISGQIGSGAREIARLAAAQLGLDYIDQEILVQAARALGVPVESVVSHDERTAGLGERLGGMLRRFLERSAAAGAGDPMLGAGGLDIVLSRTYGEAAAEGTPEVSDEQYISTLSGIIRGLAEHDKVVILGRGGQVILKDWPNAAHILLVAPKPQRIASLAQRDSISNEEAAKRIQDAGRERIEFHQKFFKVHPDDPSLYHVTVNTALFPGEAAARVISDIAGQVFAQKTSS